MLHAAVHEYFFRAKSQLKRLPIVAAANRAVKARQLRGGLEKLQASYALRAAGELAHPYSQDAAVAAARASIAQRTKDALPKSAGELNVFWVGANRDQDESGFLQGLRQVANVTVFRNAQGGYGQWFWDSQGRVRVYDPAIVAQNDQCLLQQIDAALGAGGIDVLMGQMWANYISLNALKEVQRRGIPVLNVSMDDRLPDNWATQQGTRLGAVGLACATDLVLTTASETCSWFAVEGCPAIFWPLASDPGVFAPAKSGERDIDVLFIGNKYGIRETIIRSLQEQGIHVDCYGAGWPNGPATAEESAALFKRARIILGVGTVGYCDDVFTLKLRDFDAPMAGALYLTHRSADLLRLYAEGSEIACYEHAVECGEQIRYYLSHPEALRAVADAGHRKALARDTWLFRLTDTFEQLGMLA